MSQRKLYAHPLSNNSMRAQLSLDEKGLAYEYVEVDPFNGAQKTNLEQHVQAAP